MKASAEISDYKWVTICDLLEHALSGMRSDHDRRNVSLWLNARINGRRDEDICHEGVVLNVSSATVELTVGLAAEYAPDLLSELREAVNESERYLADDSVRTCDDIVTLRYLGEILDFFKKVSAPVPPTATCDHQTLDQASENAMYDMIKTTDLPPQEIGHLYEILEMLLDKGIRTSLFWDFYHGDLSQVARDAFQEFVAVIFDDLPRYLKMRFEVFLPQTTE